MGFFKTEVPTTVIHPSTRFVPWPPSFRSPLRLSYIDTATTKASINSIAAAASKNSLEVTLRGGY